ncbi:MAG: protease modulator HflC [Legionellales bacterium]|nr:protease modulator HflC [Legionellales bacterium]|tara:strand:- start:2194 stop:3111 length:918 start_codon:yes stop_codon:yes gene_type:complete
MATQNQDSTVFTTRIIIALVIVLIGLSTIFVVQEGRRALVSRFGRLMTTDGSIQVFKPGLHFHIPFVDSVKTIDMRLQGFLVPSERIYTQEQKNVRVDYYVRYVVDDVERFYLRTGGSIYKANMILRGKINDTLREEIGKRQLNDVITGQRGDIMQTLREKSNQSAENIGIKVIDVRIVKLDYPQEVSQSVFIRMREARERMATMYRSEGDSESDIIRAKGDADVVRIMAKSKQAAADIRAAGDAKAAEIYHQAYSKNLSFFEFMRRMELYDYTLKDNETMLMDLKSFRVFDQLVDGQVPKKRTS